MRKIELNQSKLHYAEASVGFQNLCDLLIQEGNLEEAYEQSLNASKYARQSNAGNEAVYSLAYRAKSSLLLGRVDDASEALANARIILSAMEKKMNSKFTNALFELTWLKFHLFLGQVDEFINSYNRVVPIFIQRGWRREIAFALIYLSRLKRNILRQKPEHDLKEISALAKGSDSIQLRINAHIEICYLRIMSKCFEGLHDEIGKGLRLARRTGNLIFEPEYKILEGIAHMKAGDYDSAENVLHSARANCLKMKHKWCESDSLYYLGSASYMAGKYADAYSSMVRCYKLRRRLSDPRSEDCNASLKQIFNNISPV